MGYGFIVDTNYNVDIYDSIKSYVSEYNKTNGTNILCYSHEYPYLDNNLFDKIFVSFDKIKSYNQEIVEGRYYLSSTNKNFNIDIASDEIKHMKNIGNYLVEKGMIQNYFLGWNLFESVI